jgi:hypothetical protein
MTARSTKIAASNVMASTIMGIFMPRSCPLVLVLTPE